VHLTCKKSHSGNPGGFFREDLWEIQPNPWLPWKNMLAVQKLSHLLIAMFFLLPKTKTKMKIK